MGMDHDDSLYGTRVLLVEQDRQSAKLMALVLGAAGADLRAAVTTQDAIATASVFQPQLVVLGLVLPGGGGLSLMRWLRASERTRDAALVVVSALHGAQEQREALAMGCALFLSKPIDVDEIARTLATALKGKR
jgi:DNA-binding response OmpR family regulator